ncbi:MAG: PEP/pyruvate-binding domain-containing protein, partial [Candidatus Zixiibacteriota bacterium]
MKTGPDNPTGRLIWFLQERAKELSCLYKIEELLNRTDAAVDDVCADIVQVIPSGWQYPDSCCAQLSVLGNQFYSDKFAQTQWVLHAPIKALDDQVGMISVYYTKEFPSMDKGPFLKEEKRLIQTIADRLGNFVAYQQMKSVFSRYQTAARSIDEKPTRSWRVLVDLLSHTDRNLYYRISQKMLNHLCWSGLEPAKKLRGTYSSGALGGEELFADSNVPLDNTTPQLAEDKLAELTFELAEKHLASEEIQGMVEKWVHQDKLSFLVQSLISLTSTIPEVVESIRRYKRMMPQGIDLPYLTKEGVLVTLTRRLFSEQLDFIQIAKKAIDLNDIFELLQKVIYAPDSLGMLGGKSAGLFLAGQILKRESRSNPLLGGVKTPKTWYITSDVIMKFIHFNNFEEVIEQKYKSIAQVRTEYPNIVHSFKTGNFPPDIIKELSIVLDEFGTTPIVVRSSSLLEDRAGSAFSGKYKSLFLANQGTKEERLVALLDAVAEVYASIFGPDPIEYRAERGLLDFHEEMAIMIQQVVGTRVGKYYLPAYAGVAFSQNEFRWSSRIRREDGLVRMVVGLGTRAVDRLGDDYPILAAPGQPGLRAKATVQDVVQYAPRKADVINLEDNCFETVEIADLIKESGQEFPMLGALVSVFHGDLLRAAQAWSLDPAKDELVVTFDGLFSESGFLNRMQAILKTLEGKLGLPVDIEFACDGKDFYILQCRPQSHSDDSGGARIPTDVPPERILFTANKYVTNGRVPDITHIVYVDPKKYGQLPERSDMLAVGRAVSRLNQVLPKQQFILMGPGRWGSRGDIKLGVSVSYSDINNASVLIEIARKNNNYTPDLSFGTHFFQDLVEAQIRYLPLYP